MKNTKHRAARICYNTGMGLENTIRYLRTKIAQKSTHIEREQKRLAILRGLLDECETTVMTRRGGNE